MKWRQIRIISGNKSIYRRLQFLIPENWSMVLYLKNTQAMTKYSWGLNVWTSQESRETKEELSEGTKTKKNRKCPPLSYSRAGSIYKQGILERNGGLMWEGCRELGASYCLPCSISLACWEPKKLRHFEKDTKYTELPKSMSRAVVCAKI